MEPAILLSGTDPDLPSNPPTGRNRYSNVREMARGSTAQLRSAFDTIIGRTVAIKSLLPEQFGNQVERRRLLREARVTAQLQHPGTVPVYDIGDDDLWGVYFTMKRISGENLFEVLKRIARGDQRTIQAYPLSRRLEIVADTCQALAYAHARGVIHRDLKPENIWVGNFGEVVLLTGGWLRFGATQMKTIRSLAALCQTGDLRTRPISGKHLLVMAKDLGRHCICHRSKWMGNAELTNGQTFSVWV